MANFMAQSMFWVKMPADSPYSLSFARAMASSMLSIGVTATAGPKISSQEIFISGLTSATTVGEKIVPSRSPPVTTVAPAATASSIHSPTRTASSSRTIGPNSMPSSIGFPIFIFSTPSFNPSRKSA